MKRNMSISSASDSIKQLITLSDQLEKIEKEEGGDLTHIFVKTVGEKALFEAKPKGVSRVWHTLKRLFSKENYAIEKSLATIQNYFSQANSISIEDYSKLEKDFNAVNIESKLNNLAERLEAIQAHVKASREKKHKNTETLEKINFPHITVEERRLDAFENELKVKAQDLLQDPDADYAKVLEEFSRYADETIPKGITRDACNKNFRPKIEAMQRELGEAISAYVLSSVQMLDALSPKERKEQISTLRTIIMSSQNIELHREFESSIERYEEPAHTTVEKTVKVAGEVPLFTMDNLYKTLAYVVYDLSTKGPGKMVSVPYLLGLAAPTLALHLYNKMIQIAPEVASKKAFVVTYLTQILTKTALPYVTHQYKQLV